MLQLMLLWLTQFVSEDVKLRLFESFAQLLFNISYIWFKRFILNRNSTQ